MHRTRPLLSERRARARARTHRNDDDDGGHRHHAASRINPAMRPRRGIAQPARSHIILTSRVADGGPYI